ncbi:11733_t:CDS:2 [Entrophospora sp. SA101]|nr:11733_t:CDS:2 [Entrophospora sp. SA101]
MSASKKNTPKTNPTERFVIIPRKIIPAQNTCFFDDVLAVETDVTRQLKLLGDQNKPKGSIPVNSKPSFSDVLPVEAGVTRQSKLFETQNKPKNNNGKTEPKIPHAIPDTNTKGNNNINSSNLKKATFKQRELSSSSSSSSKPIDKNINITPSRKTVPVHDKSSFGDVEAGITRQSKLFEAQNKSKNNNNKIESKISHAITIPPISDNKGKQKEMNPNNISNNKIETIIIPNKIPTPVTSIFDDVLAVETDVTRQLKLLEASKNNNKAESKEPSVNNDSSSTIIPKSATSSDPSRKGSKRPLSPDHSERPKSHKFGRMDPKINEEIKPSAKLSGGKMITQRPLSSMKPQTTTVRTASSISKRPTVVNTRPSNGSGRVGFKNAGLSRNIASPIKLSGSESVRARNTGPMFTTSISSSPGKINGSGSVRNTGLSQTTASSSKKLNGGNTKSLQTTPTSTTVKYSYGPGGVISKNTGISQSTTAFPNKKLNGVGIGNKGSPRTTSSTTACKYSYGPGGVITKNTGSSRKISSSMPSSKPNRSGSVNEKSSSSSPSVMDVLQEESISSKLGKMEDDEQEKMEERRKLLKRKKMSK